MENARGKNKQKTCDMFPYRMFLLANDLHIDTLASALCHGLDNGTDLFCDPALTANDLAHILRGDPQLQCGFLTLQLCNSNCFRVIHQILRAI